MKVSADTNDLTCCRFHATRVLHMANVIANGDAAILLNRDELVLKDIVCGLKWAKIINNDHIVISSTTRTGDWRIQLIERTRRKTQIECYAFNIQKNLIGI